MNALGKRSIEVPSNPELSLAFRRFRQRVTALFDLIWPK
jgi:hypothetical protein